MCSNDAVFKLNDHVYINEVDKISVAYSAFSNEMVILHPITQVILMLLKKPMKFSQLTVKLEQMDVECERGNELDDVVSHTILELVARGFIKEGVLLSGTTEQSI